MTATRIPKVIYLLEEVPSDTSTSEAPDLDFVWYEESEVLQEEVLQGSKRYKYVLVEESEA